MTEFSLLEEVFKMKMDCNFTEKINSSEKSTKLIIYMETTHMLLEKLSHLT